MTAVPEPEDHDLLREYTECRSEQAFTRLVQRHVNAVYSNALRRARGDAAAAADITQEVFTDFARKAGSIAPGTPPGGWLHRHTGFVASHHLDRERRRRAREQQAAAMNALTESANDAAWLRTAPLLDAAMDALPAPDRDALVLRYFEQRDYRGVGRALGVSDDTAQKRVSRALEKLRGLLQRRGVASTGAALSAIMLANGITSAPAAFVSSLPGRALAGAAASHGTLATAMAGLSAAARWKLGAAAAVLVAAGAVPLVWFKEKPAPATAPVTTTATGSALEGMAAAHQPGAAAQAAKATPQSIADLITAAAGELRGGAQSISATARALALLTQIPAENSLEALVLAGGIGDAAARSLLYKYLLGHWAESDPWRALQYAANELPGEHRLAASEGILSAWAARDPEAVLGWQSKGGGMAGVPMRESLMAGLFKSLASRDLAKAFRYLDNVQSHNERAQALRGVLETVHTPAGRERVLAAADSLKDQELRTQARRAVVENWARQNPDVAASWVEKAEPAWERPRLMDSLGLTWMQSDPAAAAAWWIAREPGPDTLVKIINVWSQEDPNAAGDWLRAQPAGPQSDAARMTFARQVADLDPASALTWAATVSDESMRRSTSEHILHNWRARDPQAAAQYEAQTPSQTKP